MILNSQQSSKNGFSLIELVVVLTILLALSYLALPTLDIVQVRSREKLLFQRLTDIRRAIDSYVAARNSLGNPYPPSIASLSESIPANLRRRGSNPGPFVSISALGNPFSRSSDEFNWDIRDTNGTWHNSQKHYTIVYDQHVYDIRYPQDAPGGWEKALDETFYTDW